MTIGPYSSGLQFLHSMRELAFLEQALTQGLLLTDHKVEFSPITDNKEFLVLLNQEIYPQNERKLGSIGRLWENVSSNVKWTHLSRQNAFTLNCFVCSHMQPHRRCPGFGVAFDVTSLFSPVSSLAAALVFDFVVAAAFAK